MADSAFLTKMAKHVITAANDPVSLSVVDSIAVGETVRVEITRPRNPQFHRKFMKLCSIAFESWEPGLGNRDFDNFRKDLLILAGFRKQYISLINNEVRFEAESIAFASMSETRFQAAYRAVLDVIWEQIYSKNPAYSRSDLNRLADQILAFE